MHYVVAGSTGIVGMPDDHTARFLDCLTLQPSTFVGPRGVRDDSLAGSPATAHLLDRFACLPCQAEMHVLNAHLRAPPACTCRGGELSSFIERGRDTGKRQPGTAVPRRVRNANQSNNWMSLGAQARQANGWVALAVHPRQKLRELEHSALKWGSPVEPAKAGKGKESMSPNAWGVSG